MTYKEKEQIMILSARASNLIAENLDYMRELQPYGHDINKIRSKELCANSLMNNVFGLLCDQLSNEEKSQLSKKLLDEGI